MEKTKSGDSPMLNRPPTSCSKGSTDSGLVLGEQQIQSVDRHYRQLEQKYHHSSQYAAMVKRYDVLRQSIEACRYPELVGSKPAPCSGALGESSVNWACQL